MDIFRDLIARFAAIVGAKHCIWKSEQLGGTHWSWQRCHPNE